MVAEGFGEGGPKVVEKAVVCGAGVCGAGLGVVVPQPALTTTTDARSNALNIMAKYYGIVVITLSPH